MHGTARLDQTEIQRTYGRAIVDLRESRWSFLNTLFSVSEATLYLQVGLVRMFIIALELNPTTIHSHFSAFSSQIPFH
jgi:hypothetical protein